ncbi:hypothetical protein FH972_023492 [Carpinus fangiana]|uniref:Ras-associating domain-containing protein n=1 Tax=Carpinus fangiana TaxID=176857 RepID=A0A5N6KVB8_9ROSI|nr:hypothetical protein FH972_023492 [Carpinus fangiana]
MAGIEHEGAESLASLGARVLALLSSTLDAILQLEQLSRFVLEAPYDVVAEEFTRFKLWSGNIGLLHRGHASLDYRLRDAPFVERFVRDLLNDLLVRDVVHGTRPPFEDMSPDSDDDDSWDGNIDDIASEHDSTADVQTELEGRVHEIQSIVDRLFRLSVKIRSPASRIGSSKADTLKDVDLDTGVDVFERFYEMDCQHIREILSSLRQELPSGTEDHGLFLVERLARANKYRRQQFRYWRRHKSKLARHEVKEEPTTSLVSPVAALVTAHTRHLIAASESQPGTHAKTSLPTTATALIQDNIDLEDSRSAASNYSAATSTFSNNTSAAEIQKLEVSSFWSRVTSQPLTVSRDHLFRDLRPYVCTYEDCRESTQLYDNRSDWVKHEDWAHRRIWRCEDHDSDFKSEDECTSHLKSHHGIHPNSKIKSLADSLITAVSSADRHCPFCLAPLSQVRGTPEQHVSRHLERIASFTVPHSTLIDDDDEDLVEGDAVSWKANTARETSTGSLGAFSSSLSQLSHASKPVTSDGENIKQEVPPDMEEQELPPGETLSLSNRDIIHEREETSGFFEDSDDDLQHKSIDPKSSTLDTGGKDLIPEGPPDLDDNSTEPHGVRFLDACRSGSVRLVAEFLGQGDVSGRDAWSALHDAASRRNSPITKMLWDYVHRRYQSFVESYLTGSLPDGGTTDAMDFTMQVLCETGDASSVQFILDYLSIRHQLGQQHFLLAVRLGHEEVVRVFVNHRRFQGSKIAPRALLDACVGGHLKIVDLLLHEGADPNLSIEGRTPLYAAAKSGHVEIVMTLVSQGAIVDTPNNNGETALHAACWTGESDVVEVLLDAKASVNSATSSGSTPIRAAAARGNVDIVVMLIQHGADIDQETGAGRSALCEAADSNRFEMVQMLLEYGADPNKVPSLGRTPLQAASTHGNHELVKALLKRGADVEQQGTLGVTPLYDAVDFQHSAVVKMLLDHGADANATCTGKYEVPLLAACATNNPVILQYLLDGGADYQQTSEKWGSVLELACLAKSEVITKVLLQHSRHLPRDTRFFLDALVIASNHGQVNLISLFTAYDVVPDSKALISAISSGSVESVKVLLDGNADPSAEFRGVSALGQAVFNDLLDIVIELVRRGADINAVTCTPEENTRKTPLSIAQALGHTRIVYILLAEDRSTIFSVKKEQDPQLGESEQRQGHLKPGGTSVDQKLARESSESYDDPTSGVTMHAAARSKISIDVQENLNVGRLSSPREQSEAAMRDRKVYNTDEQKVESKAPNISDTALTPGMAAPSEITRSGFSFRNLFRSSRRESQTVLPQLSSDGPPSPRINEPFKLQDRVGSRSSRRRGSLLPRNEAKITSEDSQSRPSTPDLHERVSYNVHVAQRSQDLALPSPFRGDVNETVEKVLLSVLVTFGITNADPREYTLYIVNGNQEYCLGISDQPLLIFQQLSQGGNSPEFKVRKQASPEVGSVRTVDPLAADGYLSGALASQYPGTWYCLRCGQRDINQNTARCWKCQANRSEFGKTAGEAEYSKDFPAADPAGKRDGKAPTRATKAVLRRKPIGEGMLHAYHYLGHVENNTNLKHLGAESSRTRDPLNIDVSYEESHGYEAQSPMALIVGTNFITKTPRIYPRKVDMEEQARWEDVQGALNASFADLQRTERRHGPKANSMISMRLQRIGNTIEDAQSSVLVHCSRYQFEAVRRLLKETWVKDLLQPAISSGLPRFLLFLSSTIPVAM